VKPNISGYWVTATKEYDIKWTMPHCVLVLRHIALTFDVADGKVPEVSFYYYH